MPIALYRIDDRLIHGQVVVGWGSPMGLGFILLVDDDVATCDWEQELYRMGVPPNVQVIFATVSDAQRLHEQYADDPREGILLTGTAEAMLQFVEGVPSVREVNIGGIHHRTDRVQKMRYVFLNQAEEETLRAIEARGISVTAQDLPSTRPVPLHDILRGEEG
jgi:mannose/fructose/N-acetylgalactosamine-specific phosphotransferase system component IIB